ncbi:MAG: ankyrin repeat domain-containing protein [Armatimonadota bacterium]
MNVLRNTCLTAAAALLLAGPASGVLAAPAPKASAKKPSPELFVAVGKRDAAEVRRLLNGGADPDSRNFLQMTPLMFAATVDEVESARVLLQGGADLNATSPIGAPITFATMVGSRDVTLLLLQRGAKIDAARPDRITTLMYAARSGQADVIRKLVARGVEIHARDLNEETALSHAARAGRAAAARVLIEEGARVDAADKKGWTPLMHAAAGGHAEVVKLLIEKGAQVDRRDPSGRTALLLAASLGDHPAAVKALLAGGAAIDARDSEGRTPLTLASKHGYGGTAEVLRAAGAPAVPAVERPVRTASQAVKAALPLVEGSMRTFAERTGCVSCHHEGLGRWATGVARERGFTTDASLAGMQRERLAGFFAQGLGPAVKQALAHPELMLQVPGSEIGEIPPMVGFALVGMAAQGETAEALNEAALLLGRQQDADGAWRFHLERAPMQSSYVTITALAVRSLTAYAAKADAEETARRVQAAREWLRKSAGTSLEDRAFKVIGLQWAGAEAADLQAPLRELRADQRPDGGWGQQPGWKSDAYATGQALFALIEGGAAADDPAVRRGTDYLLRTQLDDGSWFVNKRAIPANNYFDAAFPHGQSQYASHAATCWATMALARIAPPEPAVKQAASDR